MATRMASREGGKEEGELAANRKRRMFDLSRYRGMLQRGGNKQPSRFSQSVDMSGGPSVLPWETPGTDGADGGKDWSAAKDKTADYPRKLSLDSQDAAKSPHEKKGARRTRSLPKPKGTSEYVVQKSDSLAGIALQFDTTPSELARLNKLPTRMVFPGMMLYVPDPDAWTDEETSVSSSPASPPASPPSSEIPSRRFDLPVVREREPPPHDPGHVTSPGRVVTPGSSRQSSLDDQASQKEDEFHEQFLKINVKYITAGKGTVSGVLLVTPNAIMFDPHKSDPLVIETGCEEYGLICQMDTVLSAAMYHDIRPMLEHDHKRDEIYKSGDYSQEEAEPTSSSRSSCHGNDKPALPGQRSESLEDEVFGNSPKEPQTREPPKEPQTKVEVAQLVDLGEPGETIDVTGGSVVPKPQKFVEELVPIIEEKVDPNRLSPRVLSPDAGIEEESAAKGTDAKETLADQVRKSACSDISDTGSVESGIAEMTEANASGGKENARLDNCAISETSGDALSGATVATSGSVLDSDFAGATADILAPTSAENMQESINFVDFSSGLFTTETNRSGVQDISEVIPRDEHVQQEIAELQEASQHKLLSSSETEDRKKAESEERLRERPTFLPSMTGSFEEFLPSQPTSLNSPQGPPLFLCLKVMQMKKSFTGGREVVNPGSTTLPEYWFAIPKDRADHLYAFFLQWSPDVYGHEVAKDELEVSGFVVLGEEGESLEVVDDFYSSEANLYKDWEIVTAMEARRRLSQLEVEDSLPQPTLLGKTHVLDSKNISQLAQFLPPRTEGYAWTLIYSTFEHGISLTTMYKRMIGVDSPVLLVVQDSDDNVFGALTSSPVKISEHFYGTGESFLFTFFQDFKVYKWTGDNTFFIKGDKDCLAIGGGDGQFGLWLDEMLYHGRTHTCTTFNNQQLTSQEDFTIKGLEAWGFEM